MIPPVTKNCAILRIKSRIKYVQNRSKQSKGHKTLAIVCIHIRHKDSMHFFYKSNASHISLLSIELLVKISRRLHYPLSRISQIFLAWEAQLRHQSTKHQISREIWLVFDTPINAALTMTSSLAWKASAQRNVTHFRLEKSRRVHSEWLQTSSYLLRYSQPSERWNCKFCLLYIIATNTNNILYIIWYKTLKRKKNVVLNGRQRTSERNFTEILSLMIWILL